VSQRNLRAVVNREEKTVNPVRVQDVLLGRYRLLDKIGEGGMGAVYVAHDLELERQVAVKLLASNLVNDAEVVERFEREARLTAKLDHPNIVPIFDVGRHEGRPFLVMKLLGGDSLAGLLRQKGGLTSDETQRLIRQLAAGLDYIHAQGFIHRDVKSGNIFVAPDGLATILDFGILRPKSAAQGLTRTGMVMGTPHYMAPEQALGLKNVDHRVDLYALAVVLFECLTGTLPFEADSELRLIQMQAHAPPPDIIDRAPWISRPVADVVRRALAKRPEDRFGSGAELSKALDGAYRTSRGHAAAPPQVTAPVVEASTAPSLRKLAEHGPEGVGAPPSRPEAGTPAPAPEPGRRGLIAAGLAALLVAAGLGAWALVRARDAGPGPLAPATAAAPLGDAGEEEAEPDGGGAVALVMGELLDAGEAVAAPGDEAEDAGVEDAGAEAAVVEQRPAASPRARRSGRVNVISTRDGEAWWAQVSVDGVPRGRTPLLLELPAGTHLVRVERPGFRVQSREIRVAPGKVVVRFELTP
jgi:serine/threonine-protein kinase